MRTKGTDFTEFNGQQMMIKDVPDADVRHMLGYGHHNPYNRRVGVGDWEFTPETCEAADDNNAVKWVDGGNTLICTGCGLDCT